MSGTEPTETLKGNRSGRSNKSIRVVTAMVSAAVGLISCCAPQVRCIPGQSVMCACLTGETGAQVCNADGQSFSVCKSPAGVERERISTALTLLMVLRRAVQDWQRVNNEMSCPTIFQLVEGKHLDTSTSFDDPWGGTLSLTCTDDEVYVESTRSDRRSGTWDDLSVSRRR